MQQASTVTEAILIAAGANERMWALHNKMALAARKVERAWIQLLFMLMDKCLTADEDGTWPLYFWEE